MDGEENPTKGDQQSQQGIEHGRGSMEKAYGGGFQ